VSRLEEIQNKLEKIINFDTNSSTKLSQSSITHAEHHLLLLEFLEEDSQWLVERVKESEKARLTIELEAHNQWARAENSRIKNERYKQALEEIQKDASSYMGNSAARRLYDISSKALKEDE